MINNLKNRVYKFLRWSQKYTGTDNIYLAKGGFWLTSGSIISSALVLLLAIAFANLLPKETYGTYKYVLSIFGILGIFTLRSMGTAIVQATARGYEGSLIPALKTKIRWGILGGMGCLGVAGYYYFNDNITLSICFLMAGVFLPFLNSLGIYGHLLRGRKLFKISTKYSIISQISSVTMMVIALFLTNNLFLILLTYFISHTIFKFIFLKITLKKLPPNKKEDQKTIPYGKFLSLTGIILRISTELDKILLWYFLGPVQVAVYSFATLPPQQISGLLSGNISPLALPKLSQRAPEELKSTLPKKAFKFFLIIAPLVILYIVIAPFIYKILFPQYLDSIFYSQVFALTILFAPVGLLQMSFVAQMKKKEFATVRSLPPVIRIISLLILTPLYGIIGVISAFLITAVCQFCLVLFLFKRM